MRKLRVVEEKANGADTPQFYPQYRSWGFWRYFRRGDNWVIYFWSLGAAYSFLDEETRPAGVRFHPYP